MLTDSKSKSKAGGARIARQRRRNTAGNVERLAAWAVLPEMDPQLAAMLGGGGGGDMGSMLAGFWDSPLVAQIAFPARPATAGDGCAGGMTDGSVDVGGGGSNAYRLCAGLPEAKRRAVCVYFHGNAEICTDICHGISGFYDAGVASLTQRDVSIKCICSKIFAWGRGNLRL